MRDVKEGQHSCSNNPDHCPACMQNECADFKQGDKASTFCGSCKRFFYGDTCLEQHLSVLQGHHRQYQECERLHAASQVFWLYQITSWLQGTATISLQLRGLYFI